MPKKIISLLCCIGLLLSFTACGKKSAKIQPDFNKEVSSQKNTEQPIAENERYRLEINKPDYGIVITELKTGFKWSSSPERSMEDGYDELGMPKKRHNMLDSAIVVNYHDTEADVDRVVYSYAGAVQEGRIICKSIKNGITVEYYFDKLRIMIPVDYVLYDDYVSVSVKPTLIQEENNIVTSVSMAPFFCSAKNDSVNSYLFIPSGSGATTDVNTVSQEGLSYSAQVYGEDLTMEKLYSSNNTKDIRLPVYGSKNGDTAMCTVIESAADSAFIKATVGANAYGHSAVYSSFQLRGYTDHQSKSFSATVNNRIYADKMITVPVKIRFYPLSGGKSDYNGMAEKYREYLCEHEKLTDKQKETTPLNITFIGGMEISKSFLGVPYKTVYPTTPLSEVYNIVTELSEKFDRELSINLKGFGESGIDIGKIAGGYNLSEKIGTVGELKKLSKLCKDKKYNLYMDFDILRFNSSSIGFSTFFDSVSTAGNQNNYSFYYDKAVRDRLETYKYKLISPEKFKNAAERLVKKVSNWGLTGITLSTASSLSYSDYAANEKNKYFSKSFFGEAVESAVKEIKNSNYKFCAADANAYAALNADIILDAPTVSSGEYIFKNDIPFYEIVFRGYKPMTTASVNLSENSETILLNAVEMGCGLNYTVTASWENSLINAEHPYFYGSVYSGLREKLISQTKQLDEYYKRIAGSGIVSHKILSSGLRETVFDNGITVYVNYGYETILSPAGEVGSRNFLILEKPI